MINTNMGRVSSDLNRLGKMCGGLNTSCMSAWMSYHRAVTGGPFGGETIDPVAANDPRIAAIENTENMLIEEIKGIEESS